MPYRLSSVGGYTDVVTKLIGIILAGGNGTRLYPLTKHTSKQLLPVYDKPMIYYPLSTLMLAGIREIVVISTPRDLNAFKQLLGDGSNFGITLHYVTQDSPKGLAEAFPLSERYIKGRKSCLILGDNIFYGHNLGRSLERHKNVAGAQVFGYQVSNPEDYGIAELDKKKSVVRIVEKPTSYISNIAIPGLYFFDEDVLELCKKVKPSSRGELEIVSLINLYREQERLNLEILPRGTAWFDTGTIENLLEAALFIRAIETRQGMKISSPEEVALRNKWLSIEALNHLISALPENTYTRYLQSLIS